MGLPASVRQSAAAATLSLPFRVPTKDTLTIRELADLSGMKETFIEEQFDAGIVLSGFRFNGGAGKRHSKRIPRAWAVAFLVKHARWDDESLADAYVDCLRHLPAQTLLRIADAARHLAISCPPQR